MASGDSVHSTLYDAINDPFFGEREAIKLAYGEDGSPTNEQSAAHNSIASAQPLVLAPLVVPNTDLEGTNADTVWNVTAADVVGYLGLDAPAQSNTDFYSFTGQAGTLINFQVMSVVLDPRRKGPSTPTWRSYNSQGQVIASNDDSFQDPDSTIIDLTLPYTGTYYAMVTSSPKSAALERAALPETTSSSCTPLPPAATRPPATRCTPAPATTRSSPAPATTRWWPSQPKRHDPLWVGTSCLRDASPLPERFRRGRQRRE